MVTFQVNDMTCGHCASAISRAVASIDKGARLDIRIQQKLVRVTGTATAAQLAQAIQDAGYTPRQLQGDAAAAGPTRVAGGCCCGTRKAPALEMGQGVGGAGSPCCGQQTGARHGPAAAGVPG